MNEEVLKLLQNKNKLPIKNGDKCILTHFENVNSLYVCNLKNISMLSEITETISKCFWTLNF